MLILNLTVLIAVIEIAMGIFVFLKKPKLIIHRIFMFLSVVMGIWSVCIGFVVSPLVLNKPVMMLLTNLMFLMGFFITSSFLAFSWVFPRKEKQIGIWSKLWLVLPAVLIGFLLFFTNTFVKAVYPGKSLLDQIEFDIRGYSVYAILFIGNFIWAARNLYKKYKTSIGVGRQQVIYFAIGLGLSIFLGSIFAVVLPLLGNTEIVWINPFFPIIFIFAVSYAILRYRLLDIEIIIKRTTIYLSLVAVMTGFYTFVLLLPQRLVGGVGTAGSILLVLAAAIIIAVTIQPLRDWLDNDTDRIFFQKKYDYYQVLEKLARELNTVFKLEEVINIVSRSLINEMHLNKVAMFFRDKAGESVFVCHKADGMIDGPFPEQIEEGNPLIDYLAEKRAIVETGEFKHQFEHLLATDKTKAAILKELEETFQTELVVPLIQKKKLIGLMILGSKKSGDLFTGRDIALLDTLSSQMATALENVNLYQQMLNNERLTIIGTMSAGIAHEIRNPLASIKTFIQMLPDKYDRPEFRKRFDEIVPSEIERLSGITADLLTFSKPSSPSLEAVSIPQTMDRIRSLLASQFRKKQIQLEKDLEKLPMIQADSQQLFQVFLNIFLNAIQASREKGVIKVYAEVKDQVPGKPAGEQRYMLVTIEDQGVGIKRKDLANIFQPFFTTKSEGTGLGLATCKRIIEVHKGEIYVESEETKGTKITVMLPTNLTPDIIKI